MQIFQNSSPSEYEGSKQKPLYIIHKQTPSEQPEWITECKVLKRDQSVCDPEFLDLYPKQIKSVVNRK